MKKITLSLLSIFAIITVIGQDFEVTNSIQVADGFGNHHAQIEIIEGGRVGVTWTDAASKNIYFAKHDGVGAFAEPVQLNPDGLEVQSYTWSGPDLVVEGDNVFVVFRSAGYDMGHIYVVKSTDKGETFGDTVRVDHLAEGYGQYPDIAVLNDTVYVTFMNHDAGGLNPSYDVVRSVDGGATFESVVLAGYLLPGEACDCCPPEIIVNNSRLMVVFRNNDDNVRDIKSVISMDRGESFTDWISLDNHEWTIISCPSTGPDARFISESKMAAVYRTKVDGHVKLFLNIYDLSADESVALVDINADAGLNTSVNYPQLCYDSDQIGVVWEDAGNAGTSLDVFFNASSVSSIDFAPENALNLTAISGVQTKPDIVLKNGIFHIVHAGSDNALHYLQVGETNSISEQNNTLDFTAYLSAKNENLQIGMAPEVLGENPLLTITNLQGQIIFTEKVLSTALMVDTKLWGKGMYVITIITNHQSTSKKVIK